MSAITALPIEPILSYPRTVQIGQTYLMTVDVRPLISSDGWPYGEHEEQAFYCMVNAGDLFHCTPINEPAVVVHRFGGSYGPARFLLTAGSNSGEGEIKITLASGRGVPLATLTTDPISVTSDALVPLRDSGLRAASPPTTTGIVPPVAARTSADTELEIDQAQNIGSVSSSTSPVPPPSNLPFCRNPFFVGRDKELHQIDASLDRPGAVVAIRGRAGVGKTQLATEFAHICTEDPTIWPGGVFWIPMGNSLMVEQAVTDIGRRLGIPGYDKMTYSQQLAATRAVWENETRCLLVFHNCDDPELLQQWRPSKGGARILLILRDASWLPRDVDELILNMLPFDAATTLLLSRRAAALDIPVEKLIADPIANELCSQLSQSTLALHLAAGYLADRPLTPLADFLAELQTQMSEPAALASNYPDPFAEHAKNISRILLLSYNRLDATNSVDVIGRDLLTWAATIEPNEPMPRELLHRAPNTLFNEQVFNDALLRLTNLNFIEDEQNGTYRIHPIVAAIVRQLYGTHTFRVFGQEGFEMFQNIATLSPSQLVNLLNQSLNVLQQVSWGYKGGWDYKTPYRYEQPSAAQSNWRADIISLAVQGYRIYDSLIHNLAGSSANADKLRQLLRMPALVQLSCIGLAGDVLLIAMIYDYDLDTQNPQALTICPQFEESLKSGRDLLGEPCFLGNCPNRVESYTVVCPSGFWGFRHDIGMPWSASGGSKMAKTIAYSGEPHMDIAYYQFPSLGNHLENLAALGFQAQRQDERDPAIQMFKSTEPQVVYFYCHGVTLKQDAQTSIPALMIGSQSMPGFFDTTSFRQYRIRWPEARPLVIINGCHITDISPDRAMSFVQTFIETVEASAVIDTAITIFEPLAQRFAETFLQAFRAGDPLGRAVRKARLQLLAQHNPLGLVYRAFGLPMLKLIDTRNSSIP